MRVILDKSWKTKGPLFDRPQDFPLPGQAWKPSAALIQIIGTDAENILRQTKSVNFDDFWKEFLANKPELYTKLFIKNKWNLMPFSAFWWNKPIIKKLVDHYINEEKLPDPLTFTIFLTAIQEYHDWL